MRRVRVDPVAFEQTERDSFGDEPWTAGKRETRTIDRPDAASDADTANSATEVIETLAVRDQNDRPGNETIVSRGAVPALHARRRESLPADLFRAAHDPVAQELAQRGRRDERLAGRPPKRDGLEPDTRERNRNRQRERGHEPAEADERSHLAIVRCREAVEGV